MKTIEEKANEYVSERNKDSLGSPLNALHEGYLAGYKEAQRWQYVTHELPELGIWIIGKYLDEYEARFILDEGDLQMLKEDYIEWRPI